MRQLKKKNILQVNTETIMTAVKQGPELQKCLTSDGPGQKKNKTFQPKNLAF